ncbi:MAG: hypothetical protein JOY95_07795 [Silvibacterium sp.]|nr:hypothetical protein [Silvibacterium sp.]
MRNRTFARYGNSFATGAMLLALSTAIGGILSPAAQNKKDEISFDLVPNTQFVNCLRRSPNEEPKAYATVIQDRQSTGDACDRRRSAPFQSGELCHLGAFR